MHRSSTTAHTQSIQSIQCHLPTYTHNLFSTNIHPYPRPPQVEGYIPKVWHVTNHFIDLHYTINVLKTAARFRVGCRGRQTTRQVIILPSLSTLSIIYLIINPSMIVPSQESWWSQHPFNSHSINHDRKTITEVFKVPRTQSDINHPHVSS